MRGAVGGPNKSNCPLVCHCADYTSLAWLSPLFTFVHMGTRFLKRGGLCRSRTFQRLMCIGCYISADSQLRAPACGEKRLGISAVLGSDKRRRPSGEWGCALPDKSH